MILHHKFVYLKYSIFRFLNQMEWSAGGCLPSETYFHEASERSVVSLRNNKLQLKNKQTNKQTLWGVGVGVG